MLKKLERAKPNLFVIGAMKSGTTSLHEFLGLHPSIQMSSFKEPSFFVDAAEMRKFRPEKEPLPFMVDEGLYLSLFNTDKNAVYFGESSTRYTKLPFLTGVAERIADYSPNARFIYIMRDPIERTISHYWHRVLFHAEHRPMPEAIAEQAEYRALSHYAMQLAPYIEIVGRENIKAVTSEELSADPVATLQSIFAWLDLDPTFVPANLDQRHHMTPESAKVWRDWPILNRLRQMKGLKGLYDAMPEPLRWCVWQLGVVGARGSEAAWRAEAVDYLRPIQQAETKELSQLLGRSFPEWKLLNGVS